MPFVLIIIGVFVFVSALRGTQGQLYTLLKNDLTTQGSFLYWFVAIMVIGGIGYIPALKKLSDAFLALVLLTLFVANRGFFAQFNAALKTIATSGTGTQALAALPSLNATGTNFTGYAGSLIPQGSAASFNAGQNPQQTGFTPNLLGFSFAGGQ